MSRKLSIVLGILIIILFLSVGLYFFIWHINQDATLLSISTDRQAYSLDDTIQVSIRNQGKNAIDIYCHQFCALGNFPTAVEKVTNDQWRYAIGFCPSIQPLFGSRVYKGDYIMHTLPAEGSFALELSNLAALRLGQAERFRILYYVGITKKPVYSNEFTIGP
jgi:hypothetical protein